MKPIGDSCEVIDDVFGASGYKGQANLVDLPSTKPISEVLHCIRSGRSELSESIPVQYKALDRSFTQLVKIFKHYGDGLKISSAQGDLALGTGLEKNGGLDVKGDGLCMG